MKKLFTLCLVLALCLSLAPAYAATNPLVGTWKMSLSSQAEVCAVYRKRRALQYRSIVLMLVRVRQWPSP